MEAPVSRDAAALHLAMEVLRKSGEVRFVALGSSMIPSIYPGDVVTVRSAKADDLRTGQVALCLRSNRFWLHRITRRFPKAGNLLLATQGDALRHEDDGADHAEALGRVTGVQRRGKSRLSSQKLSWPFRFLRWGVRHSSALAGTLLRYHALRNRRWAASPNRHAEETLGKPLESL